VASEELRHAHLVLHSRPAAPEDHARSLRRSDRSVAEFQSAIFAEGRIHPHILDPAPLVAVGALTGDTAVRRERELSTLRRDPVSSPG
jgi:hypothetical protein